MRITVVTDSGTVFRDYPGAASVRLSDALSSLGKVSGSCGGNGICGGCLVKAYGALSPITEREKRVCSGDGERLACEAFALGDTHIIYSTNRPGLQVLITPAPEISASGTGTETGLAVDFGTTTVAAAAYDLKSGRLLNVYSAENPSRTHGSDVMSRVSFAVKGGGEIMTKEALGLLGNLMAESGATRLAVAGNTVMTSIAAGLPLEGFARYPFAPPSLFGDETDGVYYAPCVSAYFGGDAVCGLLTAAGIYGDEPFIYADIGTNGELALFDGESFHCASVAAGPCFEGYGISCGVPASDGAICSVSDDLSFETAGGASPRGICGSGLADLAAVLLRKHVIDRTGYMKEPFYLTDGVYVTPADIRALQLAKSAVRAGIDTLVAETGINPARLILAGGFGSSLNADLVKEIGMIPAPAEVCTVGNASLCGISAALADADFRQRLDETAKRCVYTDLGGNDTFGGLFMKRMSF